MTPKEQLEFLGGVLERHGFSIVFRPKGEKRLFISPKEKSGADGLLPWHRHPEQPTKRSLDYIVSRIVGLGCLVDCMFEVDGLLTLRTLELPKFTTLDELKEKIDNGAVPVMSEKYIQEES